MPLTKDIVKQLKDIVYPQYPKEAKLLLKGRTRWKISKDTFEASSKLISGFATMVAFGASSSIISKSTADILAFISGCLGTLSLILLTFASYSGKSSRARTRELNDILMQAHLTPLPNLAHGTPSEDGIQSTSSATRPSIDMDELRQSIKNAIVESRSKMPNASPFSSEVV